MTEQLPKGWVKTTLGDINVPSRSRALPRDAPHLPYVGMEHIEAQTMNLLGQGEASSLKSSSVRFSKGDILYGKMRPYLNKVWLAEFDGLCSAEFLVFPQTEGLNSQLFAYRLNSQDFVNFANHQVSGDRPRVDFERLANFPYLLAPTREQERIVAKLDALLSRVAAGEAAARRALDRLQRYRAAVLHAAVTGELTRDWRKTHPPEETGSQLLKRLLAERRIRWEEAELKRLHAAGKPPKDDKWKKRYPAPGPVSRTSALEHPSTWGWTSLEHITLADRPICYGILMPKGHIPDGIPYVKVRDMKGDRINVVDLQRTSRKIAAAYARATLREGDLVLAIRGTYGRIAVVPPELDGGNITQDTARLSVCPPFNAPYLMWMIRSNFIQTHFKKVARGVAVKGVNIADVRATPLPLPPLDEQTEIVREVERRLTTADRLTTILSRQLERAKATRQSLLREAFAGNLVAQNPNDEPASILLERIRTAREAEAKKPKATLMPKSNTKPTKRPLLEVLRENKTPMTAESLFRESGYEHMRGESDEPQDIVDAFYAELRELTANPPKVAQQRDSKNQVLLRAL